MQQQIDIDRIIDIAIQAGKAIMEVYSGDFSVERKDDRSPVTEADKKANAIILAGLKNLYPSIPYISEETKQVPYAERKNWRQLWIIDPLDGTKEFIKRNGEFTVNIALIEEGVPVAGVVYAPATGVTYAGMKGTGSFKLQGDKRTTITRTAHYSTMHKLIVAGSRSHMNAETEQFIAKLKQEGKQIEFIASGSSLKICLVAESKADVYPRFAPTMEWDTAAAHAVALYAGGNILNPSTGTPLVYNKENLLNPFFVVQ